MAFFKEGELREYRAPTMQDILARARELRDERPISWDQVTGANVIPFRRAK